MNKKSFVFDSCNLRNKYNGHSHNYRSIEIGVNRAEVCVCAFKDKVDPIKTKSKYIRKKYIDKKTTH